MSSNQFPELPEGYQVVPYQSGWTVSKMTQQRFTYIRTARGRVRMFRSFQKAVEFCWKDTGAQS